jgi:hypothetical protein
MTRTRLAACAVAAAHLVVVVVGACGQMQALNAGRVGRAVQWYGVITGGDAGFSFFAPGVGSELRVRFTLADDRGREWEDDLAAGQNQEVRLRLGSMTGLFTADPESEAFRQDLLASWAATMFGRHPDARRVLVRVEVYDVPSMAQYRAGGRPHWLPVYSATFFLDSDNSPGREAGTL